MAANGYSFYHKGELFVTCWTNTVAENQIHACADLARRGLTPEYWHNPNTGKDHLVYADSFKLEKLTDTAREVITPENISILSKPLQKQLSAFDYDGEEWKVRK